MLQSVHRMNRPLDIDRVFSTVKLGFHIVVSGLSRSLLNLKFHQKP